MKTAHFIPSEGSRFTVVRCRFRYSKNRNNLLKVLNVGWDPEGILGPPQSGHIARRETQRKYGSTANITETQTTSGGTVSTGSATSALKNRMIRVIPDTNEELIEFFLSTESQYMEAEVARCRPRLDKDFFRELDGIIGQKRLLEEGQQDSVMELEMLRKYLAEAVEIVDSATKELTTTTLDKLKKVLTSQDKKATILEMAENNEIDQAFIDLLNQNINTARQAKNEQAAEFMEKIRAACVKYLITPEKAPQEKKQEKSNLIL
eukprot:TRINITY_DN7359_c0_g1_i1.p2 TRINITY_DN7359_c0_g1~~TRINITY_DN7359_c0_g1_i1.p2  ORF type:complete len:263 (-),score=36.66 TRINITY_DN7359_c0_g1_i1:195-983(-)